MVEIGNTATIQVETIDADNSRLENKGDPQVQAEGRAIPMEVSGFEGGGISAEQGDMFRGGSNRPESSSSPEEEERARERSSLTPPNHLGASSS